MLKKEIIDIINSNNCWAFIGSGVSTDSDCPTWNGLLETVFGTIEPTLVERLLKETNFEAKKTAKQFPDCFQLIENITSRTFLESTIKREIQKNQTPKELVKIIADLPFKGYITTNYDSLLKKALEISDNPGWIQIGNNEQELAKLSGDPSKVIWHIHGCIDLPPDKSRLIITEKDYDSIYLSQSPVYKQIQSLVTNNRMILFGFGMNDYEILRLFKTIRPYTNPTKPMYAFLGFENTMNDALIAEYLDKYTIDTIPYIIQNEKHTHILDIINVYSSMILKRSLKYGQPSRTCPSYAPETTGLLIYNELCLKDSAHVTDKLMVLLLKARVLSLIINNRKISLKDVIHDITSKIEQIKGRNSSTDVNEDLVATTIKELDEEGYLNITIERDGTETLTITDTGAQYILKHRAGAILLEDKYKDSLKTRLLKLGLRDNNTVLNCVLSFIEDSIKKRALGVSMVFYNSRADFAKYHFVALFQELPNYLKTLATKDEATHTISIIYDLLSNPTDEERQFIGLKLQSIFGAHLLGFDEATLKTRIRDIQSTLFLVDSTTLIPFAARSSKNHRYSYDLIRRILSHNSYVATTELLCEEVAEHVRWALRKVDQTNGNVNLETLRASTGKGGRNRTNEFIDGFIEERDHGSTKSSFFEYLKDICNINMKERNCTVDNIFSLLSHKNIICNKFNQWNGFKDELLKIRDDLQEDIKKIREKHQTYTHQRQTKAEAEALIIIQSIRDKSFLIPGVTPHNAYFLSHTRIVDSFSKTGSPITIRPESLMQWLSTLAPITIEELSNLTTNLFWEMNEYGFSIIDRSKLIRTFSPLLNSSEEKLEESLSTYRSLIAERYGEQAINAFKNSDTLDKPFILNTYDIQLAEKMARHLEQEKTLRIEAQRQAKLDEKRLAEYHKLKAEKERKIQKKKSKIRAAQSKKRSKSKKKHIKSKRGK